MKKLDRRNILNAHGIGYPYFSNELCVVLYLLEKCPNHPISLGISKRRDEYWCFNGPSVDFRRSAAYTLGKLTVPSRMKMEKSSNTLSKGCYQSLEKGSQVTSITWKHPLGCPCLVEVSEQQLKC